MKKLLALLAVVLAANSAYALDIASLANKVQSAADKANAKIEEAQTKQETEKAKSKFFSSFHFVTSAYGLFHHVMYRVTFTVTVINAENLPYKLE